MPLVPFAESLPVRTIPHKVVICTTHKAFTFLTLEMVHSLGHAHAQPLYLIQLGHFQLAGFRICWEQLLFLKSSHPSSWCRISPVFIPVGVCRPRTAFLRVWRLPHLQLSHKGIQGVKAGVRLFPFREVHHGKAKHVTKTGQQAVIKPVSPQVFPLI